MNKFKTIAVTTIILALVIGLLVEHQSRTSLREEMLSLKSEIERLAEQVTASKQEHAAAQESPAQASIRPDHIAELLALRAQMSDLRGRLSDLERDNATLSNLVATGKGSDIPFIYPDATKRKDYTFSGYSTPQSAFQSVLWSLAQLDPKAHQATLTGIVADSFASSIQDYPEGVMPAGYKNGAMFKATGYRVLEETPLAEDEVLLKVFLEGSQAVIKLVFKKVGQEWKWARNE